MMQSEFCRPIYTRTTIRSLSHHEQNCVTTVTTDPSAELVANLGADWYLNSTAQVPNNTGAADSNWELLTTNWQTLYATNLTAAQIGGQPATWLGGEHHA